MSEETNIEYKYTVQATNRFKKHARLVKKRNAKNAAIAGHEEYRKEILQFV